MVRIVRYCGLVVAVVVLMTVLQTHDAVAMDAEKHANIEAAKRHGHAREYEPGN